MPTKHHQAPSHSLLIALQKKKIKKMKQKMFLVSPILIHQ